MPYTHADFWIDPKTGKTWHALKSFKGNGNVDMLSMSELRDYEVPKTLAWCQSQRMTVTDNRAVTGEKADG